MWEDVDEDTFVRFGQYVYTGNYQGSAPFDPSVPEPSALYSNGLAEDLDPPAHPAVKSDTDEPAAPEPEPEDEDAEFWRPLHRAVKSSRKFKNAKGRLAAVESDFDKEVERPERVEEAVPPPSSPPTPPLTMKTAWDDFETKRSYECGVAGTHHCPRQNEDGQAEYTDVFLSHARCAHAGRLLRHPGARAAGSPQAAPDSVPLHPARGANRRRGGPAALLLRRGTSGRCCANS